jgi:hypothetical protein
VSQQRCDECRFMVPENGTETGECRRYPPQIIDDADDAGRYTSVFPVVLLDEWCGEYQRKDGLYVYPGESLR